MNTGPTVFIVDDDVAGNVFHSGARHLLREIVQGEKLQVGAVVLLET